MAKYSITDPRWIAHVVGYGWFLIALLVVLYVWVSAMGAFPGHILSHVVYYGFLCLLVGGCVAICWAGFTYRRTDADENGIVVHEGYYALHWRHRSVLKSNISAVERYDRSTKGVFVPGMMSGIRVHLKDGSFLVLTETDGKGKLSHEVDELRRALGMPRDEQRN
jgi:hypothetical protein